MLHKGDAVIVAVSGGADSVSLLKILSDISDTLEIKKIIVAHLNHSIRGKTADRDAAFVRLLARHYGFKCYIKKVNVPKLAGISKSSLEDAGRSARYSFFEEVAQREKTDKIAVAHNLDDNIETFMMRLIRGTGPKGLASIPYVRERIIRPLMDVSKQEIFKYCAANGLEFRNDKTNDLSKFTRNHIRNKILPLMKKHNASMNRVMQNLIFLITKQNEFVEDYAKNLFKSSATLRKGQIVFHASFINGLPYTLRTEMLRIAVAKLKGDLKDINFANIEAVLSGVSTTVELPGHVFIKSDDKAISIFKKTSAVKRQGLLRQELQIPGKASLNVSGVTIAAKPLVKAPDIRMSGKDLVFLDRKKLSGDKLIVRSFKPGDAFVPFGMRGSKKIQDFFVDNKIPKEDRLLVPLITDGKKVIWVAGHRLDDRVKIDASSKSFVELKIIR